MGVANLALDRKMVATEKWDPAHDPWVARPRTSVMGVAGSRADGLEH